jgi:hypothetical protein
LGAYAYLILGFYYKVGDPVQWIELHAETAKFIGLFFLVGSPFVSFFAFKLFWDCQERIFPANTFLKRITISLSTLGLSCIIYAGLFYYFDQTLSAYNAPSIASERDGTAINVLPVFMVAMMYIIGGIFSSLSTKRVHLHETLNRNFVAITILISFILLVFLYASNGIVYNKP